MKKVDTRSAHLLKAAVLGAILVLATPATWPANTETGDMSRADVATTTTNDRAIPASIAPISPAVGTDTATVAQQTTEAGDSVPVSPYAKAARRRAQEPRPEHNPSVSIIVGGPGGHSAQH